MVFLSRLGDVFGVSVGVDGDFLADVDGLCGFAEVAVGGECGVWALGEDCLECGDGGVGDRFEFGVGDAFFDVRFAVEDDLDVVFALEDELDVGEGCAAVGDEVRGTGEGDV